MLNFLKKQKFLAGIAVGIAAVLSINSIRESMVPFFVSKDIFAATPSAVGSVERKKNEILSLLDRYFVGKYKEDFLIDSMFAGMLYGVGDPYTNYMDKETFDKFMEQTEGTYAGIGVVVSPDVKDNRIMVLTPYEGAPAAEVGILPGDKFMKVNGEDVWADSMDLAVSMIKGTPGTSVKLTIYRESDKSTFDVEVMRQMVDIPTVSHKMLDNNIGYLRITNFDRVTYKQFVEAYNDLNDQKMNGLILDLRNNPGGLLDVVTNITDLLVPEGYIVYTEDKAGNKSYTYSDTNRINIPLVVIVNENSASASEVLSGAVKDMNVATLVGTTTFGKGLVQNLFPLSDGTAIKVTVAKYYTPSGVCIDGTGIEPDVSIEMAPELSVKLGSLTLDEDAQLQKAIEVMKDKMKNFKK